MLNDDQTKALAALLNWMVPESEAYKVPGAGDPAILKDILATAKDQGPALTAIVTALDAMAKEATFISLTDENKSEVCQTFVAQESPLIALLTTLIARCYYRDARVMRALAMEPRPPFPGGYEVEQGNWSLLDPVKARAPFYREVD